MSFRTTSLSLERNLFSLVNFLVVTLLVLFAATLTLSKAQEAETTAAESPANGQDVRFSTRAHGDTALRVAKMLEDEHYLRSSFSDEMSSRVLDTFLEMLDYNRIYFTQPDIDRFNKEFRNQIDDQVRNEMILAAYEIYSIYEKRVRSRVAMAKKLLKENNFTFDSDRVVHLSRKEEKWAENEAAHDQLWRNLIEGDLLREDLIEVARKRAEAEDIAKGKEPKKPEKNEQLSPEERIEKRYDRMLKAVTKNTTEDVATIFIKAISRAYDPHSEYYSQSQYENFRIGMNKSLTGIGAVLQRDEENGGATIEGLVVGGPAYKTGEIKYKDRVVGVGQGTEGKIEDVIAEDLSDIVDLIRGEKGTVVRLLVRSKENPEQEKVVNIMRDKVDLKESLATADLIITEDPQGNEQKLGWIQLLSFYSDMEGGKVSTTKDVERLLERLEAEGIDGLIVDLRDNGGGSLEEAINMTGLFIRKGPVVQARDWRGQRSQRSSSDRDAVYDGPLVVITNRASASASEIFAAALQDYNRAIIVGEKSTFGKGTVQQLRPVFSNLLTLPFRRQNNQKGALKLTIQTFFRIDGTSTQLHGVVPDIILPSTLDVADIGESAMTNPLEVEPIAAASYAPFFSQPLPITSLVNQSKNRIKSDQEFRYVMEDTATEKARMDKNEISLNRAVRLKEFDERDEKRDKRKDERIARFESIREAEKGLFTIYTFTQGNVGKSEKTLKADLSMEELSGMAKGEEDKEKEDEDPDLKKLEYPHQLGPYERETINIMQDLLSISQTGKPVTISKAGGQ